MPAPAIRLCSPAIFRKNLRPSCFRFAQSRVHIAYPIGIADADKLEELIVDQVRAGVHDVVGHEGHFIHRPDDLFLLAARYCEKRPLTFGVIWYCHTKDPISHIAKPRILLVEKLPTRIEYESRLIIEDGPHLE